MTNPFGITENSYKIILRILNEFQDIDKAIIFGSRAKGNYKNGSDIDLAIYGEALNESTALNLSGKLNEDEPIPYFIDVVAPKYLKNEDLIEHIDRVGRVFYEKAKAHFINPN